jgi:hypothetical protein
MIAPIRLVRVKATGKRFIYLAEDKGKVRCRGEVQSVSGFSAKHGKDRTFLADRVEVLPEVDYTEELLVGLLAEHAIAVQQTVARLVSEVMELKPKRKLWLKRGSDGRLELTEHARKELDAGGYDCALDGLGNYFSPDDLESAATDLAMYHDELTRDGAKEGYTIIRECAADYIYEGMLRALKEKEAKGERVEKPRST